MKKSKFYGWKCISTSFLLLNKTNGSFQKKKNGCYITLHTFQIKPILKLSSIYVPKVWGGLGFMDKGFVRNNNNKLG